ncbi:MAG: NAD-dependent epimerase/dehydratase family protein, partial [Steroidobacteraceae bacterium]
MEAMLVTGGAGYIGSHVVRQLAERGERVIVLDNLSTGHAEAVLGGELVVGDTGDVALVNRLLAQHGIKTILHFAAHIVVPESVANPLKYYRNNTANTRTLLECAVEAGVRQFVFSSTAAVYGLP